MKEIKDYLHMYKYVMCIGKNGLQYMLHGTDENVAIILETETGRLSRTYANNLKPILRPLSSITQEEIDQLARMNDEVVKTQYGTVYHDTSATIWLLSKHFDLFGLIEAGLAIDATTLNHTP